MELSVWASRTVSLEDVSGNGSSLPIITPTPTMSPASNLDPTILASLHLGLVIAASVVVALLFVFVYAQLLAILCLGYKLVSYQTIFLFNILFWASLRLTMYSFYYYHCCELVNNLSPFPNWLLMYSPSVLLYFALALLVHYFGEQLLKVVDRKLETTYLSPSYSKYQCLRYTFILSWGFSLLLFLAGSVTFSILINICSHVNDKNYKMCSTIDNGILVLSIARVALLESLLMIMGIVLGIFILVIYTTRAGKDIMDARKVSKWQAVVISILLIILFSSRAIYNMIAVHFQTLMTFGYAKISSSDMADFDSERAGDIIYFAVMLLWEVGPICLIVLFFRVKSPSSVKVIARASMDSMPTDYTTRLLINTHREDNTDSAYYGSNRTSSHVSIPQHHPGYGSSYHSSAPQSSKPPSVMPGTTPPQLFTGSPSVFSNR